MKKLITSILLAAMLISLVACGGNTGTEHKFGMFVAVLDKLSDEDVGYLDLSDGQTAHFMSE